MDALVVCLLLQSTHWLCKLREELDIDWALRAFDIAVEIERQCHHADSQGKQRQHG